MRKLTFPALIAVICVLSAFTFIHALNWTIAPNYSIKFSSDHPSGVFTKLNGNIQFDEKNLSNASFDVSVDVASINTGSGMMNRHAKSAKWFDAKQFPTITFKSNSFTKTGSGYAVTGNLTIHGITKVITIPFTFNNNTFVGSFNVNRLDYKVGTNEGMSAKASTNIKIDLSVPVNQ
jgi:polyisoprenoid-binding protein YceI